MSYLLPASFIFTASRRHSLTPLEVLEVFLMLHRRSRHHTYLLYRMSWHGILAAGAPDTICPDDDKQFDVVENVATDAEHVVFLLEDGAKFPYRLELVKTDSWRVKSFRFQCLGCFGEGGGREWACGVCGGSGWGIL